MLMKPTTATAAAAAFLASIMSGAAASPLLSTRQAPVTRPNIVLKPIQISDGSPSHYGLADQATYYWSHDDHGVLGNFTVWAAEGYRLLSGHRFQDEVQALNCSSSRIDLTFVNSASFNAAKTAWSWVNEHTNNTAVYIVDGGACSGPRGRKPYYISSISYNDSPRLASMTAAPANWADFAEDAALRIHSPDAGQASRRDLPTNGGDQKVTKSFDINTAHDFSRQLFSTNVGGVQLGLSCPDCKITGGFHGDISLTMKDGIQASLVTTNGFGVRFALGITASGTLTQSWESGNVQLASIPLGSIDIPDVGNFGPELTYDISASIGQITAKVEALIGVAMTLPDGVGFSIGQGQPGVMTAKPILTQIGPTISGTISTSVELTPLTTVDLSATLLGKGFAAGIGLQAPFLIATINAGSSSAGGVCDNAENAVSIQVNAGMQINLFGGEGAAKDQPNKFSVYTKSVPVFGKCFHL